MVRPGRSGTLALPVLLLAASLAGCIAEPVPADGPVPAVVDDGFVPRVVIGVLDTGLAPYHQEWRQVRDGEDAQRHPSTYLTGYPAEPQALQVTLDLKDEQGRAVNTTEQFLEADKALWEGAKDRTLYWVPGTKFVGFIGFDAPLPGSGHGAMTATRLGGNTVSIGGPETLVVVAVAPLSLEVGTVGDDAQAQATRWLADQSYIDIQSHSWGMPFTCAGLATGNVWGWPEAFKYAREKQLVLVAAGNGAGNTGVTPGYPSQCQDNSGVAGVVAVGANDNDGSTTWGNFFPALSGDGCGNPSVSEEFVDQYENSGGGTSSATPYTAGGAAKVILEARRILRDPNVGIRDGVVAQLHPGGSTPSSGPLSDGTFTLEELKLVLFHTAIAPPRADASDGDECLVGTRVPADPESDPAVLFPFIGYGETTVDSVTHAIGVLRGEMEPNDRSDVDELYAQDQEVRRAIWG